MSSAENLVLDPDGDVLLVLSRPKTPNTVEEVEVKASSKHLTLASRVFRVMFDGRFREGIVPEGHQLRRVPLPDDDADATMLLLQIIHGRARQLPQSIDLAFLKVIAILVDKYALHEVTDFHTGIYYRALYDCLSSQPSDLADWIFLSWVFGKAADFREFTRKASFTCSSQIDDNGLPFPASLANNIEIMRLSAIRKALTYLDNLVNRYLDGVQHCDNPACGATVLGDLLQKLKSQALFPLPQAAAVESSVQEFYRKLRAIKFTSLCDLDHQTPTVQLKAPTLPSLLSDDSTTKASVSDCGIGNLLHVATFKMETEITGLDLKKFSSTHASPLPYSMSCWY